MKKYFYLAALFIFFFASCKKDVNLTTPDRKIVVDAQISPADDTIKIILEYSKPVNTISNTGYSNNLLHDIHNEFIGAAVTLSDGITAKVIKRDPREGLFKIAQADFPLTPGKTYYLHVKNGLKGEVTAQTTIPQAVTNAKYSFLGEQAAGEYNSRYTNKFEFNDQLNKQHYYRLYSGQQSNSYPNELLYGNHLQESNAFTGTATIVVETIEPNLFFEHNPVTIKYGYFFSCSDEYFKFYTSIENTKGLSNTPELLEEPVNIYTNIKGGLGIFAGYNLVKIKG
ncbi:MAG: DUF4249 domain-containing protein [Ferruginibacter sp.]